MTSDCFSNHSLNNLESSWTKTRNNCQCKNQIVEEPASGLKVTLVENSAKNVVETINKDQSLLPKKVNNLPDLLEETSQDYLTMLNKPICFQLDSRNYGDCGSEAKINVRNKFVDSTLISDKDMLQDVLMFSKDMQQDMGEIISHLQSQIINLISGYKVLKSKNILLEHKLKTLKNDNLLCKNCKKKKVFKDKSGRKYENHLSHLEELLGDKQMIESNLPSPPRLDPQLLAKISNILSESENFLKPIEQSLTSLQLKMQKYQTDNDFETNRLSLTSDYENESDNSFSSTNYYSI